MAWQPHDSIFICCSTQPVPTPSGHLGKRPCAHNVSLDIYSNHRNQEMNNTRRESVNIPLNAWLLFKLNSSISKTDRDRQLNGGWGPWFIRLVGRKVVSQKYDLHRSALQVAEGLLADAGLRRLVEDGEQAPPRKASFSFHLLQRLM